MITIYEQFNNGKFSGYWVGCDDIDYEHTDEILEQLKAIHKGYVKFPEEIPCYCNI